MLSTNQFSQAIVMQLSFGVCSATMSDHADTHRESRLQRSDRLISLSRWSNLGIRTVLIFFRAPILISSIRRPISGETTAPWIENDLDVEQDRSLTANLRSTCSARELGYDDVAHIGCSVADSDGL
jgi:hypothetical protein